jgi:hypothetical protein
VKWDNGKCQLADRICAEVWIDHGEWRSSVDTWEDVLMTSYGHKTEDSAKAAVCHWIGKTMEQFSNALAAGCNAVDDGA